MNAELKQQIAESTSGSTELIDSLPVTVEVTLLGKSTQIELDNRGLLTSVVWGGETVMTDRVVLQQGNAELVCREAGNAVRNRFSPALSRQLQNQRTHEATVQLLGRKQQTV